MLRRTIRQGQLSQKGFIKSLYTPYLLLALALVTLLSTWNTAKSRDKEIANLQQTKATEIAGLEEKLQQNDNAMAKLTGDFNALQADHTTLTNERLPELQQALSLAKADNQRARHVSKARANLVTQLQAANEKNQAQSEQLQLLPELKRELSFTKAENQRASHVAKAKDNLQRELEIAQGANKYLGRQLLTVPDLKRELSFANAKNQRAEHINTARLKLIEELSTVKAENLDLHKQVSQMPGLTKQLSMARAENARLQHVNAARSRLMAEVKALRNTGTN